MMRLEMLLLTLALTMGPWAYSPPAAYAATLPSEVQAPILLRALAYDRNLGKRGVGHFVVAVVYRAGDAASEKEATAMHRTLQNLAKFKVQGRPLRVVKLAYENADALQKAVAQHEVAALYIAEGLRAELPGITRVTRGAKITSMTGQRTYVEAGVALGVVAANRKPKILINLNAGKAEGASFSSSLMRLADVI